MSELLYHSPERYARSARIEGLNLSNFEQLMRPSTRDVHSFRYYTFGSISSYFYELLLVCNFRLDIFATFRISVTTWNVGGRTPTACLNLEDLLQVEKPSDIYVIG